MPAARPVPVVNSSEQICGFVSLRRGLEETSSKTETRILESGSVSGEVEGHLARRRLPKLFGQEGIGAEGGTRLRRAL